jgi:Na+/phosphate symporter
MFIEFGILVPMFLLALGIFLLLKTQKRAWKTIGWILVAVGGLLLVLVTRTGL